MMLAKQFDMTYTDKDNTQKYPYIIHRTSLGCYERTIAMLLETTQALCPWAFSGPGKILPISERQLDRCREILQRELRAAGLRVELDERSEKIGYKDPGSTAGKGSLYAHCRRQGGGNPGQFPSGSRKRRRSGKAQDKEQAPKEQTAEPDRDTYSIYQLKGTKQHRTCALSLTTA